MFREEILSRLSTAIREGLTYSVTTFGTDAIFVEGYSGIKEYEDNKIILRVSKKYILIQGINLHIKEINDRDIYIVGKISRVEYDYES